MATRITVDYENNAEEWWAAFEAAPDSPPELSGTWNELIVSDERAQEIEDWCAQLPGWDVDSEYARYPLLFNPID